MITKESTFVVVGGHKGETDRVEAVITYDDIIRLAQIKNPLFKAPDIRDVLITEHFLVKTGEDTYYNIHKKFERQPDGSLMVNTDPN